MAASGPGCPLRGLAILIRKGMAAWIHAYRTVTSPAAITPPAAVTRVPLPAGVQREVVDVLATMALTTTLEVRP